MKAWAWFVACGAVAAALGVLLAGCGATRAGYETAAHKVVMTEGSFELRDYPETRMVKTRMPSGRDTGFMRLFRFISGDNARKEKIAMTTPVLMERGPAGADDSMAFVLPKDMPDVPAPAASDVTLASMQGGRFAVHRFHAARPDPEMETKAEEALRDWMRGRQLASAGQPLFAYFDPPWIPRWFRRNEVMLRVEDQPARP